mgnify:CR=1 FL=1
MSSRIDAARALDRRLVAYQPAANAPETTTDD